jgi:hypothetical protein
MLLKKIPTFEKINNVIAFKLCALLSFLKQTTTEFETVAEQLEDKDIKMALLGIAVETNQYANELDAQLKSFGIHYLMPMVYFNNDDVSEYVFAVTSANGRENAMEICNKNESFFTAAYFDILKHYIPYDFLRNIIRNQFKGIKTAFFKMRLLDQVKPAF